MSLRQMTILLGLPNEFLVNAIASGGIELRSYERDVFVADPYPIAVGATPYRGGEPDQPMSPIFFVARISAIK